MKKRSLFFVGLWVTGAVWLTPCLLSAKQIAPASLQDIVSALGPDARGLSISKETLPDLFALTANRIEENPKLFVVEQPYTDGRWKGGKVVIEYARDMSYTIVSVYDKDGNRQRIYSVGTRFASGEEKPPPAAQPAKSPAATRESDVASLPAHSGTPSSPPTPPAKGRENVSTYTPSATNAETNFSYEWDEVKAVYVPASVPSEPPDIEVSAPANSSVTIEKEAPQPPPAPQKKRRKSNERISRGDSGLWVPPKANAGQSPAGKVEVGHTVWVEKQSESASEENPSPKRGHKRVKNRPSREARHVPEPESAPERQAAPEAVQAVAINTPMPKPSAEPQPTAKAIAAPAPKPPPEPKPPANVNSAPAPVPIVASSKMIPAAPQERMVLHPQPSSGEQWVPRFEKDMAIPPPPKKKPVVAAKVKIPKVSVNPRRTAPNHRADVITGDEKPKPAPPEHVDAPRGPVEETVPSTEELLASPRSAQETVRSAEQHKAAPPQKTVVAETPVPVRARTEEQVPAPAVKSMEAVPTTEELLAAPDSPVTKKHHETLSRTTPTEAAQPAVVTPVAQTAPVATAKTTESVAPPPAIPSPVKELVPSTEEISTSNPPKMGADTSASDAWVPKATSKPVVAEPPPEPVKVAMVPKPVPMDNSVENMLKIGAQGKSRTPNEGDAWVPQKTVQVKPEVDEEKEVARIRAEEKKQAIIRKPAVKIKRDINNPEEGVLPVSSFEKFSGPMYGRHREYERRFIPGAKPHSKAPNHDFYVDEIDRKKENHNIYYYVHQTGKAPKLVAVERHDKVSFLGNYDIEKEDKGKTSTY